MKQQGLFKRILCVSLALCLFSLTIYSNYGLVQAKELTYDTMNAQQKQEYLEQKLQETETKLQELGTKSKDTKEYLTALDEKVAYLNQQLSFVKTKVSQSENKIISLRKQYAQNQNDIKAMGVQIKDMEKELKELTKSFNSNFEKYAERLRAMYISGETNVLAFLITSTDISELLTRYEMVNRVAKQDSALLKAINDESKEVKSTKENMAQKQVDLTKKQSDLVSTQKELGETVKTLEIDKKDMEEKESILSSQQSEANSLLKKITDETKEYTEYRDTTKEDLAEIDEEIAAAAEKYEQQTTTTTTTTTKKHTTNGNSGGNHTTPTTTKKHTTTQSNRLNLTFPIPSQTTITTGFYGYSGHTGCDFACDSGSRVVAAESGTVIISRDLTNSDGSYRSYGRYIVIAHDKLDSNGNRVYTLYAHNSKRVAYEGQYVSRGQLIAYSGSTGNSTGPHCHFEVRTPTASYDDCVDPQKYLP